MHAMFNVTKYQTTWTSPVHAMFNITISRRLSLANSFEQEAAGAVLELDGDEEGSQQKIKSIKRW